MSKYTPGPWKVEDGIIVSHGKIIAEIFFQRHNGFDGEISEANANCSLTASAPELLEACKSIISLSERQQIGWKQLDPNILAITKQITEAIAKAEGK